MSRIRPEGFVESRPGAGSAPVASHKRRLTNGAPRRCTRYALLDTLDDV
jgi:hypothetical protein